MLGAAPPRAAAARRAAGRGRPRGARAVAPARDQRSASRSGHRAHLARAARSSASPASPATARPSCWPRCRARTGARPPAASSSSASTSRGPRRARAGAWASTRPRGTHRPRLGAAGCRSRANTLLTRREPVRAAAGCAAGAARRLARAAHRALRGAGPGARDGRGEPVGRKSAEVHRRARGGRGAPGAGGRAADLGSRRRRRRADPARDGRALRTGARAALVSAKISRSCSSSAIGSGRDRGRTAVAAGGGPRRDHRPRRAVDERACSPSVPQPTAEPVETEAHMLRLVAPPSVAGRDAGRRRWSRWR